MIPIVARRIGRALQSSKSRAPWRTNNRAEKGCADWGSVRPTSISTAHPTIDSPPSITVVQKAPCQGPPMPAAHQSNIRPPRPAPSRIAETESISMSPTARESFPAGTSSSRMPRFAGANTAICNASRTTLAIAGAS